MNYFIFPLFDVYTRVTFSLKDNIAHGVFGVGLEFKCFYFLVSLGACGRWSYKIFQLELTTKTHGQCYPNPKGKKVTPVYW